MKNNKRYFSLLIFVCVGLFIVFVFLVFRIITSPMTTFFNDPESNVAIYITEDGNEITYDKRYVTEEDVKNVLKREDNHDYYNRHKDDELGALYEKTPYFGDLFTLSYDLEEAIFYVYFNRSNVSKGNMEFDEFLKQNGFNDRSEIPNLQTSNTPLPTPQP